MSVAHKQLYKVTEINKALGMCRTKITISNNSTLSLNSDLNEVIPLCIDSIYSFYYIYFSQHNYIIKA